MISSRDIYALSFSGLGVCERLPSLNTLLDEDEHYANYTLFFEDRERT